MRNTENVRTDRRAVGVKPRMVGAWGGVAILALAWLAVAGEASAQGAGSGREMRALKCHVLVWRIASYDVAAAERRLRVCETLDWNLLGRREPLAPRWAWEQEMRDVKAAALAHMRAQESASLKYAEEMREIKWLARNHRPRPDASQEAAAR